MSDFYHNFSWDVSRWVLEVGGFQLKYRRGIICVVKTLCQQLVLRWKSTHLITLISLRQNVAMYCHYGQLQAEGKLKVHAGGGKRKSNNFVIGSTGPIVNGAI